MDVTVINYGARGETVVALLRLELPFDPHGEQPLSPFVIFIRTDQGQRVEQWAQVDMDPASAFDRFHTALEDFLPGVAAESAPQTVRL